MLALDTDCNGWDVREIAEEPTIVREYLPTSIDPTFNDSGQWFEYGK
jgi:hypothetical protein